MTHQARMVHQTSVRVACRALVFGETCYQLKLSTDNAIIADWLIRLRHNQRNWGFGFCCLYLRNVKRFRFNHKRVYRIYAELELKLRIKSKKKLVLEKPEPLAVPESANRTWSLNFMHDALADGRSFRLFNVLDDFNRRGLAIEANFSWPSVRVIGVLEQRIERRGAPRVHQCDNGPEYISGALVNWAEQRAIRLDYIKPGKPHQNGYVERYNRTVRYEWLAQYLFDSIKDVQQYATRWLWSYNNERPNMALGGITRKRKLAIPA